MDHVQVLHGQERADAHPVGDFERDQTVSKTLLPLELRRDKRAAGKGLCDSLRVLELLNPRKDGATGACSG